MNKWYEEDNFNYFFSLLLECTDGKDSRPCVAVLLKYCLVTLKMQEREYLTESEDYEVQGDDDTSMTMTREKALSARFINKALSLLKTHVAKNWSRQEQFHEVIYFFAIGDTKDANALRAKDKQSRDTSEESHPLDPHSEGAQIGLEFLYKNSYII